MPLKLQTKKKKKNLIETKTRINHEANTELIVLEDFLKKSSIKNESRKTFIGFNIENTFMKSSSDFFFDSKLFKIPIRIVQNNELRKLLKHFQLIWQFCEWDFHVSLFMQKLHKKRITIQRAINEIAFIMQM